MTFSLIFAIFCSGRRKIQLFRTNHWLFALVIAHGLRLCGPLQGINFLCTPLHHYTQEIMIFTPIFAIFCSGRGNIQFCNTNYQASAPVIVHRRRPYGPLGCINFPFAPLYYYIHDIMTFPLIFAIFCSGGGDIPLCKNNHQATALQNRRRSTSYASLRCIKFPFTLLYYCIHEIMIFPSIFAIFCSGRGNIQFFKANHQGYAN
jgi:hypothetical protein